MGEVDHHNWLAVLYAPLRIMGKSASGHFHTFTGHGSHKCMDNLQSSQQK